MLIRFSCNEYENIIMFGDAGQQLLIMMGQSGILPGALKAEQIPEALALLQKNLKNSNAKEKESEDEEKEPPVSLPTRAVPLINMLKMAVKKNADVLWQQV